MIFIYHGDDQYQSLQAFQLKTDEYQNFEQLRFDNKNIDYDKLNQFVNSASLFGSDKVLILDNSFSLVKTNLEKLQKIILNNQDVDVIIWQDKTLKPTEISVFKSALQTKFPLDKKLFACLSSLKPGNIHTFCELYQHTISQEPFELFFFWLKNNIRKNLGTYSKFPEDKLKDTYLSLINFEYKYKTGQLFEPKENGLLNILVDLMS